MKKTFFFFVTFCTLQSAFSQDLAFDVLSADPAYCRIGGYQNGNGVLYASATGGVPAYTYLWTDLTSGETSTNTTWGGRNVGCYSITITDEVGTIIMDTICIDSINPIAILSVISDDVLGGPTYYYGTAPANVTFENLSENIPYGGGPPDPWTPYSFKPHGLAVPEISYSLLTEFNYNYEFGGVWTASLIATNRNGCADTAYVSLDIDGPLTINETNPTTEITVLSNNATEEISVIKSGENDPEIIHIYDITGQLILTQNLNAVVTKFAFNLPQGIYLYQVVDAGSSTKLFAGKFVF